ncbi:serine/threonine-protein kinase [Massilibacteroides vaginae]|uniref:serine/threonine-protein kinase n=1 Tax=Massilibacteroides vaginae TaxID=1673718 RepID=UPI000A1CCFD5|nr:serine/threonine-protein kinase [Massilibacteroides vaginae]
MDLPNGYILQKGKFKLKHVVGQGGFGITYNGVWFTEVKGPLGALTTEIPVCIKEYFFKDYCYRDKETNAVKVHSETGKILFSKFKEKLIKEAKILSDVSHPYIVNVLEVFEENNTAYIVMEYISGCSLKYMLDNNGVLSENKTLKYTRQIGEALSFVHQNSILHLDIKPSNILIDKNDNARLIDFGVSKRYDIASQETSTTMLTLSKGFASIEQYDDEGTQTFSPCPDIYSLGATMYNLITGKVPTESILRATRPLIKPSEINPEITPKTEAAILKAMEIIPENRFQCAADMLNALDIPPEEPLEKNTLQETYEKTEDETVLLPTNKEVKTKTPVLTPVQKTKKALLLTFIVIFSTVVFSAISYVFQKNFAQEGHANVQRNLETDDNLPVDIPLPVENNETTVVEEDLPQNKPEEIEQIQEVIPETRVEKEEEIITSTPLQTEKETQPITGHNEDNASLESSIAENEIIYKNLIASGKEKMNTFDFDGAKKDFTKAKNITITEEVVRLLISCDLKESEKRIERKMELYDFKMSFGKLRIVTNKVTKRYGAINDKAEEIIPCKYITVGRSESGRAFEREDHLFDIYSESGELLGNGLTYY